MRLAVFLSQKPNYTVRRRPHGYDRCQLPQRRVREDRSSTVFPSMTGPLFPVGILNPIRGAMGIPDSIFPGNALACDTTHIRTLPSGLVHLTFGCHRPRSIVA